MKKILSNSIYNVVKVLISMLFPVITYSYASRIFLSDGMGQIDYSKSVVSIFTLLAMLGIQNYGIRECAAVKNDRTKLSKLCLELLVFNFVSTIIVYTSLAICLVFFEIFEGYELNICIYSITIGLSAIGMEWLYSAQEDFKYIAIRTCVIQAVSFVLMLIFVKERDDIFKYLLIQAISNGGANVFNFVHARKYIDFNFKFKLDLKRHFKPIMHLFLMTAFIKIFTDMDSVMLGSMVDDSAVGLYNAAYKLSGIVSGIMSAAVAVIAPTMSIRIRDGSIEKANSLLRNSLHFILALGIPIVGMMCVFRKPLLVILGGNNFIDAESSAFILAFRGLLSPINGLFLLNYLIPHKKDRICVFITAVASGLNVATNVCLIPILGHTGASIATVAAESIELLLNLCFVSKLVSMKYLLKGIWKYLLSSLIVMFVSITIKNLIDNMYAGMLAAILVSAPLYLAVLKLLKLDFLKEIIDNLKQKNRGRW